jgi:hypothetical protein
MQYFLRWEIFFYCESLMLSTVLVSTSPSGTSSASTSDLPFYTENFLLAPGSFECIIYVK